MPNHCDADLAIDGPAKDLDMFLAKYVTKCDGSVLNLDTIQPYPTEFKEMDRIAHEWERQHPEHPLKGRPKDGFNAGGYEWCIENWGTKWGCYNTSGCSTPIEKTESGVILHFSTAWNPFKVDLLQKVSGLFPNLTFTYDYFECGAGFQGTNVVEAGALLSSTQADYDGDRGG
jgi:hypothetical protein